MKQSSRPAQASEARLLLLLLLMNPQKKVCHIKLDIFLYTIKAKNNPTTRLIAKKSRVKYQKLRPNYLSNHTKKFLK